MSVELLKSVAGGSELLDWFDGHAPRFHDAEVLSIAFDREGPACTLRVHAFKMTGAIDADGYYVLEGHVVVTFRIEEVTAMQLDDFNHQSALMALNIARAAEGEPDAGSVAQRIWPGRAPRVIRGVECGMRSAHFS